MPPKGPAIWENSVFLNNLVVNLYEAANQVNGLGPAVKEAIVESLHQREHDISWEAIRWSWMQQETNRLTWFCVVASSTPLAHHLDCPSLFQTFNPRSSSPRPRRCTTSTRQIKCMKWDPVVHEDLLIAMFQHISLTSEHWAKVMNELRAKGYEFSENALRWSNCQLHLISHHPRQPISPPTAGLFSFFSSSSLTEHLKQLPPGLHTQHTLQAIMPSRGWDATSHEALLLAFIDKIKPNKAMVTLVTERMKEMGYTYSYDAINQHVQKLRKNRDVSGINKAAGGTTTPTKTTPSKPTSARKRKTPSRKNAKELTPFDDEEEVKHLLKRELSDEELEVTTPTKKAKINEQLRQDYVPKLCKAADTAEANEANEI
ncbi:Uncharacterized protein TCAP_01245 [Tolypocladium capitatum]|uniref:Uncharacterized protein n=1 Tax=Tolypocladium capitatum TaxID=45235 RepID=A0A2K3QMR7_9HYPO|nr:Uncharacterized protein TCAP_01245 [Tolypocladium capitatum]